MALQSYHDESTGKFATRAEYLAAIGKLESDLATEYEQSNAILAELIKKKPEIEALVGQFTREIFVKNHNLLTRTLAGVANGGADAIRGMHGLAYTLVHEPSAMKAAAEAIIADPSLIPKGVWAPFKERIDAGDYAGALGYAIPALVEVVYGSKGGVAAGKGAVETAKTGLDTIQKIVKRDTNKPLSATEKQGILREASQLGKGNLTLRGSATRIEADELGKSWVGPGYRTASDGKTLVSADGLRTYRPPTAKPNSSHTQTGTQINLEKREFIDGKWQVKSNAHLDISD